MKIQLIQWIAAIAMVFAAILIAGSRFTQSHPEAVAAAPSSSGSSLAKEASLDLQATTVEEVEAREVRPVVEQTILFRNEQFGYHVSYPLDWEKVELSAQVVLIKSPDETTRVKVEAVGPLPADGLKPFVDRTLSLSSDIVISRQWLTIHGLPAERVIVYSDKFGGQATNFYIEADVSAYVVTGMGAQRAIEMIARSFNAPQLVAQR